MGVAGCGLAGAAPHSTLSLARARAARERGRQRRPLCAQWGARREHLFHCLANLRARIHALQQRAGHRRDGAAAELDALIREAHTHVAAALARRARLKLGLAAEL